MSAVTITTQPIPAGSQDLTLCHDQTPVEVDVYANGARFTQVCGGCVKDVPGYDGTLRLDDVIPDHWTVRNPDGTLRGFYGGTSAEQVRGYFTHGLGQLAEQLTITPTTARVLFGAK